MFRRTGAYAGALVLLVLAGCQDSGPLGSAVPIEGDQEAFDLAAARAVMESIGMPELPPWAPPSRAVVGGPAAVPAGFEDILINGDFETRDFTGWVASASGTGVNGNQALAWQVGPVELQASRDAHLGQPHDEPLNTTPGGANGATGVNTGTTTQVLFQDLTLPGPDPDPDFSITLRFNHRFKSFFGDFAPFDWFVGTQDYLVEIRDVDDNVILPVFQASAGPEPGFSGLAGTRDLAEFVAVEDVDLTDFAGQDIRLIFTITAFAPLFVDIDDVEIYLETDGGDPDPVAFDDLTVKKAKVKVHKPKKHDKKHDEKKKDKDKDEFEVEGRITLGELSNGIDPATEGVTINFGEQSFTIPAELVHPDKHGKKWKFRGKKPGITKFELKANGDYKVKAKGLDLSFIDLKDKHRGPVTFTLAIGDDTGTFHIDFDKKGRFKVKKHHDD